MNVNTIKKLNAQGKVVLRQTTPEKRGAFILSLLHQIIRNAYLSTWHGPDYCSYCGAHLVRKVKDPKTKTKTKKWVLKNQHEAMTMAKHTPNCKFAMALATLSALGEL